MKTKDIRELTAEELARTVREHRQEAFNLRLQAQTGQLENSARMRIVRREIATLLTEQRVRELKPQTTGKTP